MTVREYILDKLKAFDLSEAQLVDMSLSSNIDFESDVRSHSPNEIGRTLVHAIEDLIFAPRLTSINESGFSMSWNYESLGKYYLWLCRKWGVTPDENITELLGLSIIRDKTSIW